MSDNNFDASRLLKLVQSCAIKPEDAHQLVRKYRDQVDPPGISERKRSNFIADKVIGRYAKLAGMAGGASGLAGVVPGIGTIAASVGGGSVDAVACMKLQVDMCMCLAASFGYDLTNEDAHHLSFLIAAGGTVEQAAVETTTKVASKAGVRMLRRYLRGAALTAVKEYFKKVGIVFTRKSVEKALPFGIGAVLGSSANYGLTRYVGRQAKEWFVLDAKMN